jgi:hypothetical protein
VVRISVCVLDIPSAVDGYLLSRAGRYGVRSFYHSNTVPISLFASILSFTDV